MTSFEDRCHQGPQFPGLWWAPHIWLWPDGGGEEGESFPGRTFFTKKAERSPRARCQQS